MSAVAVAVEPSGSVPGAPAQYRTGVIWGVLGVLVIFGTAASAFFVWGVLGLVSGPDYAFSGFVAVVGAFVAVYVILLIAGILYRIDRLRGTPHRRIELFE